MKSLTLRVLAFSLLAGCKALSSGADSGLDDAAAFSTIMNGAISNGTVLIPGGNSSNAAMVDQVKKQLSYAIGELNENGHGTDLSRSTITITNTQYSGSNLLVTYNAALLVAWANNGQAVPAGGFQLYLPASVADSSFWNALGGINGPCVENGAGAENSEANFWYYYHPLNGATLADACATAMNQNPGVVVTESMVLTPSPIQTMDKAPEYGLIWQNGRFNATFLFGRYLAGQINPNDPNNATDYGVNDFQTFAQYISGLAGNQGQQQQGNVDGYYGVMYIEWQWSVNGKPFDVVAWLTPGDLTTVGNDQNFVQSYQTRAAASNLLMWNGHSQLGANLEELVNMGVGAFTPSLYQLMVINACDSYSVNTDVFNYDSLAQAAATANQGSSRYFDLITNAAPADFTTFVKSSQAALAPFITNAQTGQAPLFTQILAGFDATQHAVVRYENDNPSAILTPPPF